MQCLQNDTTGVNHLTPVQLRIGAFNQTNAESKAGTDARQSFDFVVHPEYNFKTRPDLQGLPVFNNDIALLLLNESSTKQVIRLPAMQGELLPAVCSSLLPWPEAMAELQV